MVAYWEIAAHSAYDMFSKYKYLIVNLVFPTWVFGVGFFFLIISHLYLFISKGEVDSKRHRYVFRNIDDFLF